MNLLRHLLAYLYIIYIENEGWTEDFGFIELFISILYIYTDLIKNPVNYFDSRNLTIICNWVMVKIKIRAWEEPGTICASEFKQEHA